MLEEATAQPYTARDTRMTGVRACNDWEFKVYEIAVGAKIEKEVVDSAMKHVAKHVVWPSTTQTQYGFVIVHAGEQAVWVLVHLWMDDILRQFVFCAPLGEPTMFRASPMDGFNACVWELEVTKHERDAWVRHVLANPMHPRIQDYLNDSLEIVVSNPASDKVVCST